MHRIILIGIFALLSTGIQAQIGERTKDRAEQKANNRVDRKIDQGIDSGLDAIEGLFKKKNKNKKNKKEEAPAETAKQTSNNTQNTTTEADYSDAFGGAPLEVKEYSFNHAVDSEMKTFDKKGKLEETFPMQTLYADGSMNLAILMTMDGANSTVIMDTEEKKSMVLTEVSGMKMAMVTDYEDFEFTEESQAEIDDATPTFTKTGKTREIAGYSCVLYTGESEDYDAEYWVTDEIDLDMYRGFAAMYGQQKGKNKLPSDYPQGMMMEMTSVDKKTNEKFVVTVTNVQMNKGTTLSTEGYKSMSFGQ